MRKRLKTVEENQKILAKTAKESMFILNVTRVELAKNRGSIDELISKSHLLSGEVDNISVP